MKIKINEKFKNSLAYFVALGGLVFFFILMTTSIWIGQSVEEKCVMAQEKYGGECVEALRAKLEDPSVSLDEKNKTVWALGQLGDRKALSVLKKYYTGEPCDHEKYLCQYELEKAIKLLDGGFNLTRLFRLGQ